MKWEFGRAPESEVWHFSEDPNISRFIPHISNTAKTQQPLVWACPPRRCPDYWFPRDLPRAMAWRTSESTEAVADRLLGVGVERLHVIELSHVHLMTQTQLYAYRFAAAGFSDFEGYAAISDVEQFPLGPPVALASPWEMHSHAGIPVLVVGDLFPWWQTVVASDLGFSGIRLRNSPNFRVDPDEA